MVHGGKLVWQILRIVCGFIAGVLAAGLFLSWGLFQTTGPDQDPIAFAAMLGTAFVTASVLGGLAFVPAAVAIVLAELLGWRGIIYHLAAAGLIALGLWTLGNETMASGARPGTSVALAAGFLGGLVYWLIAGCNSGGWRSKKPEDPGVASDL
ncbi:translation initiation factor IF-3 [uncultured Roseibium sp.]|uniref:translation initiation factor IF-3 n=1 Tax=uncultured Roseibium sp. TaxID=1936171 RepID=UPI0032178FF9